MVQVPSPDVLNVGPALAVAHDGEYGHSKRGRTKCTLRSVGMSLTRHYHALAPVLARIPPAAFPDPAHLSKSQDALIKSTLDLEHPNAHSPTAQTWRRLFWRRMIRIIEQGFTAREAQGEDIQDEEVHPRILEAMLSYLVEPPRTIQEQREPNLHLTRRYFWGPPEQEQDTSNCVETVEDGRMISGGTTGLRTWSVSPALRPCCSNALVDAH